MSSSHLSQHNVPIGVEALQNVTNDPLKNSYNIGIGYQAGNAITTGTYNTALGNSALF